MSALIFRLNGVPEEEAEAVRQLLREAGLDFYETSAGRWGISVAGIWLKDESRVDTAKTLLQDYGRRRQQEVRSEYQQAQRRGELPSLRHRISQAPLHYLAVLLVIAAILYLSISPFLDMGEP